MSDIWELQDKLDEAKARVIENAFAYGAIPPFKQLSEEKWRAWCDIDEALEQHWEALNNYVAFEEPNQ